MIFIVFTWNLMFKHNLRRSPDCSIPEKDPRRAAPRQEHPQSLSRASPDSELRPHRLRGHQQDPFSSLQRTRSQDLQEGAGRVPQVFAP